MLLRLSALTCLLISLTAACQPPTPKPAQEAQAVKVVSSPEATPSTSDSPITLALLLGRWVSEKDPDTGFEPWTFFDDQGKVYGDGYEEGTPYRLDGDQIIYESVNGTTTTRVIELSETRFVEESEGGIRTVWTRDSSRE